MIAVPTTPQGDGDLGEVIFDWNSVGHAARPAIKATSFFDETLRDGLQNPSVTHPGIDGKLALLRAMAKIGVYAADIGIPASSPRAFEDVVTLCREVQAAKLPVKLACAGRTLPGDMAAIIEASQRTGVAIEAYAFIGSSPIRQLAETWEVSTILRRSGEAIDMAVKAGLSVAFVMEDSSRSRPAVLEALFKTAIEHGARRLCLCDTAGHSTPAGVRTLITFTRGIIQQEGVNVAVDWHGHNDRGLALENSLVALEVGADRVHATALGIGERVGNAQMELILLNLKLLGLLDHDLADLLEYCEVATRALGWEIPINYPLVGRDAFRTATGVHAASIVKANAKGHAWLADRVYSAVPAGMFGRSQEICIGPMSGVSNVKHWLQKRHIEPSSHLVNAILSKAKAGGTTLGDEELCALVDRVSDVGYSQKDS